MKKALLVLAILGVSFQSSWSQSASPREPNICGTTLDESKLRVYNPAAYQKHQEIERLTQDYIERRSTKAKDKNGTLRVSDPQVTITIPVVVHVMFNTPEQNISDTQIRLQIEQLNRDFRGRRRPPAEFANLAADVNIEFQLACVDPNGNPTTGIRRVSTNTNVFPYRETAAGLPDEAFIGLKFLPNAGPWPREQYLNIWSCDLSGDFLGYAQRPGSAPNVDGVVVDYKAFGTSQANLSDYNQGCTATHEVGHWLNLNHTFGANNNLCDDDGVADTPLVQTPTGGCPNGQLLSCGASAMYQNHMDYTFDDCKSLFTIGQRNRMRALFAAGGPRESFISAKIQQAGSFYCTGGPYIFSVAVPEGPAPTYNWSVTGWLQITSGQGTNQITCTSQIAPEGHQASISVSANGYCETKQITYGVPLFYNGDILYNGQRSPLGGSNGVPEYSTVQFPYEDLTTYQFDEIGGGYAQVTRAFDNECDIYMPSYATNGLTVRITKTNPCGSVTQDFYFEPNYYYRYSPNPANDYLVVEAVSGSSPQLAPNAAGFDATLYDNYGRQVKTKRSTGGQATIDIRALPNGLYNLRVGQGKKAISNHIQITH